MSAETFEDGKTTINSGAQFCSILLSGNYINY
jgi:hypothetical protein